MAMQIKSKIAFKIFNPKSKIGDAEKAGAAGVVLGVVIGQASGVRSMTGNDGSVMKGLTGSFALFLGDPKDRNGIQAGVLWLPGGFVEPIASAIENAEGGAVVQFAYRVRLLKADNPAGYEYQLEDLQPATQTDPLARLAETVGAGAPAIEDKSGTAPAGDATKAKDKAA